MRCPQRAELGRSNAGEGEPELKVAPAGWEEPETGEHRPAARQPPFSNMAATGVPGMCPSQTWLAQTGGPPREGDVPSQRGGNLAQLPALRPRLAVCLGGARRPLSTRRRARDPETPARDWSSGDDVRRRGATFTRARARAQSRAIETRRRSVRPGRSLMRSRKVRGPAGGVRAA